MWSVPQMYAFFHRHPYTFICACICICMCVCVFIHVYVCIFICVCVCVWICKCPYTYTCLYIIHICTYIYIHHLPGPFSRNPLCMECLLAQCLPHWSVHLFPDLSTAPRSAVLHTYIHSYIHTYTHTHIHTYIHKAPRIPHWSEHFIRINLTTFLPTHICTLRVHMQQYLPPCYCFFLSYFFSVN